MIIFMRIIMRTIEVECESSDDNWDCCEEVEEGGSIIQLR